MLLKCIGFIEHGEADLGAEDVVGRRHRHFHEPAAFRSRVGAEEYLDFMQEKYSNPRAEYDDDDDYEDEEAVTEVDQQSLLPSVRDPKLWMVKCAVRIFITSFLYVVFCIIEN